MHTTTSATPTTQTTSAADGRWPLRQSVRYAALIAPVSFAALIGSLRGRRAAERWQDRAATAMGRAPADTGYRAGHWRLMVHYLGSIPLGLVALMLLGFSALLVARGALYGLVDTGPYDTSWGGPSLAGAWLAHFVVATPVAVLGLVLAAGVARLHFVLTQSMYGHRTPRWATPVSVLSCVAAVMLLVAWLQQV